MLSLLQKNLFLFLFLLLLTLPSFCVSAVTCLYVAIFAGQYFRRHLPLANGIVTAGSGVGALVMGPLYHLILSNLGWRMMLRIISCVAFLLFVCALFYRPLPAKYQQAAKNSSKDFKFLDFSVWKIKPFVMWVMSMSFLFLGYFVPFLHLVSVLEFESKISYHCAGTDVYVTGIYTGVT